MVSESKIKMLTDLLALLSEILPLISKQHDSTDLCL